MAIHVRSTRNSAKVWKEWRLRLARTTAVSVLLAMIVAAIGLYVIRLYRPVEPPAQFTAFIPEETPPSSAAPASSRSVLQDVKTVPPQVQPVIVSTAVSSVPLVEVDVDMGEGDMPESLGFSLAADIGGGLGDGISLGNGQGDGDGDGDGLGNGRKGGRLGYNDDIQVVLALDASGSMDYLFRAVAESLEDLLHTLKECHVGNRSARVSVGIVVYGQYADNGCPYTLSPFSSDLDAMQSRVSSVNCDGAYECCGDALEHAIEDFPWNMRARESILKVIFIAGNESFDQGSANYRDVMKEAEKKGIIVNTIHCGEKNIEWAQAAKLGNGVGLTFNSYRSSNRRTPRMPREEAVRKLYELEILPTGSPAEQVKHAQELSLRQPLPESQEELSRWMRFNLESLYQGYAWDAVEMYRRLGAVESLDALGGRGNMPLALRSLSDEALLQKIESLAEMRSVLRAHLMQADQSEFIRTVLETLIKQGESKGIYITR